MSDHDPLCRNRGERVGLCLVCDLIAKVRADEREKIILVVAVETLNKGLADLRAKVEALPADYVRLDGVKVYYVYRDDVLALFDGSSDD